MRAHVLPSLIKRILVVFTVVLVAGGLLAQSAYAASGVDANDLSFYRPSITTAPHPLAGAEPVHNVILCLGDGMGVNQVALASLKANGAEGKLHLERLPVVGLVRTYSADSLVTDSAAAATAIACGVKTSNGMIGMTPDEQSWYTVLELAQAKGMATGLVVTSSLTDATPAAFAAHVKSRRTEDRIAELLLASEIDVLFGGGRRFFLPQSDPGSGRRDDRDLLAQARQADYMVIATAAELRSLRHPRMLGLFQLEALTTVAPEPNLALLTETAIDALRQSPPSAERPAQHFATVVEPDSTVAMLGAKAIDLLDRAGRSSTSARSGFCLMVEGSLIDWACHQNDAAHMVRQTLLFDQAVEKAVAFSLRDGHTLVLVTADHETGGLTLTAPAGVVCANWSTQGHSGAPVPIWAIGPGAGRFAGVQDNTDIAKKIAQLLDIRPFPRARK